jgi:uncharacterized SAM-binding protein YcdF (DUF218 family)
MSAAVVLVAALSYGTVRVGSFLYAEDMLQRADAIFSLAGTRMERQLEAADLYREGWAPLVVLPDKWPDQGIEALRTRGITLPSDSEVARDTLIRLGVPETAILIPPVRHDNTAHEAYTLRSLASARRWKRVIVVSSKYHTRRAGMAMRRELDEAGVEVVMRGSRYDAEDPAHWWRTRSGYRWIGSELPKLVLYRLGLGM